MNERIRELVLEAGFVHYGEDMGFYNIPVPAFNGRMEKFAELIIKECSEHAVDFFRNMQSYPERVKRGNLPTVDAYILDRMGVE